jgi:hypothetical protein
MVVSARATVIRSEANYFLFQRLAELTLKPYQFENVTGDLMLLRGLQFTDTRVNFTLNFGYWVVAVNLDDCAV